MYYIISKYSKRCDNWKANICNVYKNARSPPCGAKLHGKSVATPPVARLHVVVPPCEHRCSKPPFIPLNSRHDKRYIHNSLCNAYGRTRVARLTYKDVGCAERYESRITLRNYILRCIVALSCEHYHSKALMAPLVINASRILGMASRSPLLRNNDLHN